MAEGCRLQNYLSPEKYLSFTSKTLPIYLVIKYQKSSRWHKDVAGKTICHAQSFFFAGCQLTELFYVGRNNLLVHVERVVYGREKSCSTIICGRPTFSTKGQKTDENLTQHVKISFPLMGILVSSLGQKVSTVL